MRIVIAGGPKVGKTTLSEKLRSASGSPVFHTDDLIGTHDWSKASEAVARWFDRPGPWIVEGVAAVRALRKWMDSHHRTELPCDIVYFSNSPRAKLVLPGQVSMAKGVMTVWSQIGRELIQRGVKVEGFPE